jgi:hypothetical protein
MPKGHHPLRIHIIMNKNRHKPAIKRKIRIIKPETKMVIDKEEL